VFFWAEAAERFALAQCLEIPRGVNDAPLRMTLLLLIAEGLA